jgi:hypothetical protein
MRLFVGTLLLLFLPGVTAAFALQVVGLIHVPAVFVPLGVGAFLGFLLDQFLLRRVPVVATFEHELTHAAVALLFFRRVTGFFVRKSGGTVVHQGGFGGKFGTDCIGLAPYILPLFTTVSVLARPFIPPEWFPWYDGWIGLTFGLHVWSAIEDIRVSWTKKVFVSAGTGEVAQTDIARRGFIYSTIFIATCTLALHGLLIAFLLTGSKGLGEWAWQVWSVTGLFALQIRDWGKSLAGWISAKVSG